jgi:hypothetical protein
MWEPDLVIIMHAINDLSRSFSPRDWAVGEYDELWSHSYGPAIKGARPGLLTYRQYLYKKYLSDFGYAWYSTLRYVGEREKEIDYPLERYISIGKFEHYLDLLLKYIRQNGSDVLIVSQPSIYKEDVKDYEAVYMTLRWHIFNTPLNEAQIEYPSALSLKKAMDEVNGIAEKLSLSKGVLFVDAAKILPKDTDHFRDDLHYTDMGKERMARIIGDKLFSSGMIEKRFSEGKK